MRSVPSHRPNRSARIRGSLIQVNEPDWSLQVPLEFKRRGAVVAVSFAHRRRPPGHRL